VKMKTRLSFKHSAKIFEIFLKKENIYPI